MRKLEGSSVPPRERASMWSTVGFSQEPQIAQGPSGLPDTAPPLLNDCTNRPDPRPFGGSRGLLAGSPTAFEIDPAVRKPTAH
jgi:hypothetical protein